MYVPCKKCLECRYKRALRWSARLLKETNEWYRASIVTLTYDNNNLPSDGLIDYSHIQHFITSLRNSTRFRDATTGKRTTKPLKYFAMCEYGTKNGRPHYHIILYGYDFDDAIYSRRLSTKKTPQYVSSTLNSLWDRGIATVGKFSASNKSAARYVCNYGTKYSPHNKQGQSQGLGKKWMLEDLDTKITRNYNVFEGYHLPIYEYQKRYHARMHNATYVAARTSKTTGKTYKTRLICPTQGTLENWTNDYTYYHICRDYRIRDAQKAPSLSLAELDARRHKWEHRKTPMKLSSLHGTSDETGAKTLLHSPPFIPTSTKICNKQPLEQYEVAEFIDLVEKVSKKGRQTVMNCI